MSSMTKNKKISIHPMMFLTALSAVKPAVVHDEVINIGGIYQFGIIIHLIELVLAIFICFMAIKFFRITKPLNLFLVVYISVGFFAINSLLYLLVYLLHIWGVHISFISVYFGSRVSLIAMLVSLSAMFYYFNWSMRKTIKI